MSMAFLAAGGDGDLGNLLEAFEGQGGGGSAWIPVGDGAP